MPALVAGIHILEQTPVSRIIVLLVVRGLDPRIHADRPQIDSAAWIAGSSPAKTGRGAFQFKGTVR
jgi:hypothetical protein